jgi:hypothetical protein
MDILNSLESLLPKYQTTLPFSKQTVSFVPFRVKDAKNISIILQEENRKLALTSLVDILKTNVKDINILDLCMADAEFLFLQIRSKSVDEQLNLIHNKERIQVAISEIYGKNSISSQTISLTNSVNLVLETPTIKDLLKLNSFDKEDLIQACIKKVIFNGEIFHVSKYLTDEIKVILDNLPMTVLPKFEEFMKTQPDLFLTIKTEDGDKEVNGFLTFFTYR